MKQQYTGRRVAPFGHISRTPESASLCFCSSMSCT